MNLSSISKTVRGVALASLILLTCAICTCYVGERRGEREVRAREAEMAANDYYISDTYTDLNNVQIAGAILFPVAVSVALAALMLWKQDRRG